ncbi:GDP-mannose 4,6-dehydratase [Neomoorella mulderi]|uniref:GDP-mannose 4,6-dehydratase n=1 Tax=Neomoorella mulderi TaxID=202604 RepID=UPI000A06CAEA
MYSRKSRWGWPTRYLWPAIFFHGFHRRRAGDGFNRQFPHRALQLPAAARVPPALQRPGPIPVYGDGQNVQDWVHVEDHSCTLDLVLQKGQAGEVYNVDATNEHTNMDIVKTILRLMNKPETLITFVKNRPGHD